VNRSNYRTRHANSVPGWGPAPGWDQPLSGWTPLLDHGPPPLRAAGSVARWWWPALAVAGFLVVVVYVTGHDPGLSQRGLLTIALAALVVVLLTIHRTAGPSRLARAAAEYTAVALLAALLTLTAAGNQPPATPAAKGDANQAATASAEASQDRPRVLRVAAGVIRVMTKAIRAVTGAASWVADLWRQADQQTDRPNRSSSTSSLKSGAKPPSSTFVSASTWRST
jgi:multisubunit Na+/H+ antiporter MnhB subunit